jgi:hypothetical protein
MHTSSPTFLSAGLPAAALIVWAVSPVACSASSGSVAAQLADASADTGSASNDGNALGEVDSGSLGDSGNPTKTAEAGAPPADSGADSAPAGPFSLGQTPFTPTSSWNTLLPASATFTPMTWPSGVVYSVGWSAYSAPIYVAAPTDPLVQVNCPASWGWPANPSFRIPSGATGAPGTDGEIVVIDGTTVNDLWQFDRTSDTAGTAQAFAATDVIMGSGWGTASPFLAAGIMAAGSSELAGMIVQAETDAGEIHHAIQLEMPAPVNMPGYAGNAISGDGQSTTGTLKEGDQLAIPAGTPMPAGLSPLGQKVFRALQTYGGFDIDSTDCCTVATRAQQNAYDQTTMSALLNDVPQIFPLLQRVN